MYLSVLFCCIWLAVGSLGKATQCPQRSAVDIVCRKPCQTDADCTTRKGRRRKCICDDDCGLSCAKLNQECSEEPPGKPVNGFRKLRSKDITDATLFQVNDVVTYSCKPGYTIIGPPRLRCSAIGKFKPWDQGKPRCGRACPDPGVPNNGRRSGDSFEAGDSVFFRCNPGYRMTGQSTLECQPDLKWNGKTPECEVISCAKPPSFNNARIGKGQRRDYLYGDRIQYICNSGYYRSGINVVICAQSGWSDAKFQCLPKSCGNPGIPRNGKREGNSFKFLQVVTFSCDSGFELDGPAYFRCQADQTWDGTLPACNRVDCGEPNPLARGSYFGSSTLYGSKYSITCHKGYAPDGPTEIMCQADGTWSVDTSCQEVSCDQLTLDNGVITGLLGLDLCQSEFNCKLSFKCDNGYYLSRKMKSFICLESGTWSDTPPTCSAVSCGTPPKLDNSVSVGAVFTYKSVVKYQCWPGYYMVGHETITCQANGRWSATSASCPPKDCGIPPVLSNGAPVTPYRTTYPSTVRYGCNSGFQLKGSSRLSCQPTGAWSANYQECQAISCPLPRGFLNGYLHSTGSGYLAVLTYKCNEGFQLHGVSQRICRDSPSVGWDRQEPQCIGVDCGAPRSPTHGFVTGDSYKYNDVVSFFCSFGYELSGAVSSARCLSSGFWSATTPHCRAVTCGDPPSVTQGDIAKSEGTSYKERITYACKEGYKLRGNSSIVCLGEGWWSVAPHCDGINCGQPDPSRFIVTHGSNFNYGDVVRVRCVGNNELIGSPALSCGKSGRWNLSGIRCRGKCNSPLGLESGNTGDYKLTSSSNFKGHEPRYGRLNGNKAWCGFFTESYRLFFDIQWKEKYKISSVAIQGGVDPFGGQRWPTQVFFWTLHRIAWKQTKYYTVKLKSADDITQIHLNLDHATNRLVVMISDGNLGRTSACGRFEIYGCKASD